VPQFMLLLYAPERDETTTDEPREEMSEWIELTRSLREAGLLVANGRLTSTDSATTVRVRHDKAELVDGPFAVTKEILAGYFLLECADLDVALKQAERLPIARYGSVEVRAVRYGDLDLRPGDGTATRTSDQA
jgi:hypothetical protein